MHRLRPMPSHILRLSRSLARAPAGHRGSARTSIRRRCADAKDATSSRTAPPRSRSTQPHNTLIVKLAARIAVEPAGRRRFRRDAAVGERARDDVREPRDLGPQSPVHFIYPEPPDLARSGNPRLCAARAFRPDARSSPAPSRLMKPDQGRLHLRARRHHGDHRAVDVVRAAARRLPGFRAYHDFRACAASACRPPMSSGYLRTVPRSGAARLEGADAMHAWVMVWCGDARLVGPRPDQRPHRERRSCGSARRSRLCRRSADRRRHARLRRTTDRRRRERYAG